MKPEWNVGSWLYRWSDIDKDEILLEYLSVTEHKKFFNIRNNRRQLTNSRM